MEKIKSLIKSLEEMNNATYLLLKISIIVSIVVLFVAIILYIAADFTSGSRYLLLHYAKELGSMPQSILLLASIASVIMEDMAMRQDS